MDAAFPQNGDTDARRDRRRDARARRTRPRRRLARTAARPTARISAASPAPTAATIFAREGLLFGSDADVAAATGQMIEAQPFLGPLAADPSLRGIAGALGTMLQGVARGDAPLARIDRPMAALADALDAQAAGKPAFFSWQALFGGGNGALAAPTRRLVLVNPMLDYGALMPGAPATRRDPRRRRRAAARSRARRAPCG